MNNVRTGSACLLLAMFVGAFSTAKAESVFDFESVAPPQSTTFTNTVNGLSATFTAIDPSTGAVVPNGFYVTNSSVSGNSFDAAFGGGNYLYQNDNPADPHPSLLLQVSLSTPISNGSFNFATNDPNGSQLTLTPFLAGQQLTPVEATSSFNPNYSVAKLSFSGFEFDSFTLSGSSAYFAIDDLSVTPASDMSGVPEPVPVGFCLLGMAGLLGVLRQRQGKARDQE